MYTFKDHPIVVLSTTVAGTIALCFAIIIPLHNMVVEKKDGTIETKQATVDSLKEENESLRRRLQGDVVLVSTNDLSAMQKQVAQVEDNFTAQIQTLGASLSQLSDIKATLDKSISRPPQAYGELRRVANIRPNGASVNWMGDRRTGTGMVTTSPSAFAAKLHEAFVKMNEHSETEATAIFKDISASEPLWPYSYFYLALTSINSNQSHLKLFEDAAQHFEDMRKAGIVEPELLLYESMTRTFLGQFDETRNLLMKLNEFNDNVEDVVVMVIDGSSPEDIQQRFQKVSEKCNARLNIIPSTSK